MDQYELYEPKCIICGTNGKYLESLDPCGRTGSYFDEYAAEIGRRRWDKSCRNGTNGTNVAEQNQTGNE